ncbi:MAG TPA: methyltransferase domain-containing protein [Opitutales bacterium]|nr:methyltransferase domain-containing protein [Opitutales bacterium]
MGLFANVGENGEDHRMIFEKKTNRRLWDAWTDLHFASEFYDVDGFRQGQLSLPSCDIEAVGSVEGLSLLHLQCHFGMDTLSWARLGATVTGVDFSGKSIARARQLAEECEIEARFVETDVYAVSEHLAETFDLVVATAGVLPWLPDLSRWAQEVAKMLRPGGRFYLREFHPQLQVLDETSVDLEAPLLRYPYFPIGESICSGGAGSYAVPEASVETVSYEWPYTVGGAVQALLDAGLELTAMKEFPYTTYRALPWLEEDAEGNWRWPGEYAFFPLMYALQARKAG